jgi:trimethylamine:corrinoid methyltransferase-like protein
LWADHDAEVDSDHEIVHIPEHVLMNALSSASKRITLYGKSPEWDVVFDTLGTVCITAGEWVAWVLALENGHRQRATIHLATGNLEQMYLASYEKCVKNNEILEACFRIAEVSK